MPVKPVDSRLSEPAVLAVVFNSDSRLEREALGQGENPVYYA